MTVRKKRKRRTVWTNDAQAQEFILKCLTGKICPTNDERRAIATYMALCHEAKANLVEWVP